MNQVPNFVLKPDEIELNRFFLLKKIFITVIIFIFTFFLAEMFARILVVNAKPTITYAVELDRKYQLSQIPFEKNKKKLIFLGDSLMDFAIYPELLSAKLRESKNNVSIKNLATPGNTFELSSFLLTKAIESGNRPDIVIYNIHPRLFNKNFAYKNTNHMFEQAPINQCKIQKHTLENKLKCLLSRHFYLIMYQKYFKQEIMNLKTSLLSPKSRLTINSPGYVLTEVSPSGWAPGYNVYTNQEFKKKFLTKDYFNKISPELLNYSWTEESFKNFLAICKKEHIILVMIWLPENPISENYYHHFNLSSSFLNNQFSKLFKQENIQFINMHDSLQDASYYYDPDHLNVNGAIRASKKLAYIFINNNGQEFI
jgi:hypothetical protein